VELKNRFKLPRREGTKTTSPAKNGISNPPSFSNNPKDNGKSVKEGNRAVRQSNLNKTNLRFGMHTNQREKRRGHCGSLGRWVSLNSEEDERRLSERGGSRPPGGDSETPEAGETIAPTGLQYKWEMKKSNLNKPSVR